MVRPEAGSQASSLLSLWNGNKNADLTGVWGEETRDGAVGECFGKYTQLILGRVVMGEGLALNLCGGSFW